MDHKQAQMDRIKRAAKVIEIQTGKAVRPYRTDGYVNLLNRYGTQKDTSEQYRYQMEPAVPDEMLTRFYEGNGLFSTIIDAPAEEAVKHGFELDGIADQKIIDFYTEALDELDWEETAMTAVKWARLFGGAIAVMLINDGGKLEDPLNWKNIKSIDDIRVYDRSLIQPDYRSMFSYSPNDPFRTRGSRLGMPEYYHVYSKYGNFTVHDSRCLVFQNGILPENTSNSLYELWGMPEYIRIHRAIRDAEVAHGTAPKMLDRSIQAVYKMKDLSSQLATEQGEDLVLKRLQTIDMARGLLNSITIDSEGEDYDFRQFQFSGVSEVIDSTCNFLSAISHIPQTILFGRSPAGMNSTGISDMENWYNYVDRYRHRMLKKNLRYLLSVLFQAGLHTREVDEVPPLKIKFTPLWSLSESEQADLEVKKATTQLTKAQAAQVYVDMQAIDPTEVRHQLADSKEFDVENMLDEYEAEEDLVAAMEEQGLLEGGPGTTAPAPATSVFEEGHFADYAKGVDLHAHNGIPDTSNTAPAAAPAATKLPQDMSAAEKEQAIEPEPAPLNVPSDKIEKSVEILTNAPENKDSEPEVTLPSEPATTFSVGVIVVKEGKVLCGTRHNDFGYGLICGPGGHSEEGETPEQAAFRETEEEFGISPLELIPLGLGPKEPDTGLTPYLYLCTKYEGEPYSADLEVVNIQFRTLEELKLLEASMFQPFADGLAILNDRIRQEMNHDGGPGSGNHGHEGVPGKVGGSAPGEGTSYRGVDGSTCKEYGNALNTKSRAQIAKMAEKDPRFKALTDTVSLYTQGGYSEQRKVAEKLVNGTFSDDDDFTVGDFVDSNKIMQVNDLYKGQNLATSDSSTADGMAELIGTINESEPYDGKLYRATQDRNIIKANGEYEPFVAPDVGDTIQISAPTSFTTDKAVADKLMTQKMGDRIYYTVEEGANVVDVSKLSPYKQKEVLSCGTYEVVAVNKSVRNRSLVYGEPTYAQSKRGLVDYYGSQVYEEYDIEIQLRQVGKVSIGVKADGEHNHVIVDPEQFEERMVLDNGENNQIRNRNISEKSIDNLANSDTITSETNEDGGPGSGRYPKGSGNSQYSDGEYKKKLTGLKTSAGKVVKSIDPHLFKQAKARNIHPKSIADALMFGKRSPGNVKGRTVYSYRGTDVIFVDDICQVKTAIYKGQSAKKGGK